MGWRGCSDPDYAHGREPVIPSVYPERSRGAARNLGSERAQDRSAPVRARPACPQRRRAERSEGALSDRPEARRSHRLLVPGVPQCHSDLSRAEPKEPRLATPRGGVSGAAHAAKHRGEESAVSVSEAGNSAIEYTPAPVRRTKVCVPRIPRANHADRRGGRPSAHRRAPELGCVSTEYPLWPRCKAWGRPFGTLVPTGPDGASRIYPRARLTAQNLPPKPPTPP